MRRRRVGWASAVCGLAALVALAGEVPDAAGGGFEHSFEQRFIRKRPSSSTAARTAFEVQDPGEQGGRPTRALRGLTVSLGRGAEIDTSAPKRCRASKRRLRRRGKRACPRRSRVGEGSAEYRSGARPPEAVEVDAFNRRHGLALLMQPAGSPPLVARAKVLGRDIAFRFRPRCARRGERPPCERGEAALTELRLRLRRLERRGRSYITTPPRCPSRERWRSRAQAAYDDGYIDRGLRSSSPCVRD